MEAIVLAGGLGTRLRSLITDIPKPMAPVNGKPFLYFIFEYLYKQGINRVILSIGYKHDVIEDFLGNCYKNIHIIYSVEDEPLGTGGAIKKALEKVSCSEVFILNGDTFFGINLNNLYQKHLLLESNLTLALKPMKEIDRYGIVLTSGDRIIKFEEKKYQKTGNINGGLYIARNDLFSNIDLPEKFSFEKDFLEVYCNILIFNSYIEDSYFIDIGIPKDYETAQRELICNI